ncbi:hypothetical protein HPP92_002669 [Vanilla planifolia]|uniref:Uncharacterized protein n=1 Tax=Vanilla planifolia TaxID=51239 RepID=A0A835VI68_VANPL|nr:hypothetical protein HPP92_002669 [Vanilla planifolia]
MAFSRRGETEAGEEEKGGGRYQGGGGPRGRQSGGGVGHGGDAVDDVGTGVFLEPEPECDEEEGEGWVEFEVEGETREEMAFAGVEGADGVDGKGGHGLGGGRRVLSIILRYGEPPRSKLVPSVLYFQFLIVFECKSEQRPLQVCILP